MSESWLTPKTTGVPRPRPHAATMAVTPIMPLSEGPLSPVFSPVDPNVPVENTYASDGDVQALKKQMEKLSVWVHHLSQGIPVNSDAADSGAVTLENLESEKQRAFEAAAEAEKCRQLLKGELEDARSSYRSELTELRRQLALVGKELEEEGLQKRQLARKLDDVTMTKSNLESYMNSLPSYDEFERLKAELNVKTETLRRCQIDFGQLKERFDVEMRKTESLADKQRLASEEIETLKMRLAQADALNGAHAKRMAEAKEAAESDDLGDKETKIEVLMSERDRFATEVNQLKTFIRFYKTKSDKEKETVYNEALLHRQSASDLQKELTEARKALDEERTVCEHLRNQVQSFVTRLKDTRSRLDAKATEVSRLLHANEISFDLHRLQVRAVSEMSLCVNDLKSLTSASKQIGCGEDPDVSNLFGVHTLLRDEHPNEDSSHSKNDEERLKEVQDLLNTMRAVKSDISTLREIISEKYANSLTDQMTSCATQ